MDFALRAIRLASDDKLALTGIEYDTISPTCPGPSFAYHQSMSTIERPPRHLVSGPKDQFDMLHSTACAIREVRRTAKVPPLAPEPDLRIGVQPRSIPDG